MGRGLDEETCQCIPETPIIVDTDHTGFNLTSAPNGVDFDLLGVGDSHRVSWTAANSTNAFLALDRNGNGTIDNGNELFGNVTPQPVSNEPNGFLALAEFDKLATGGNGDGKITAADAVFPLLLLWRDVNHNGISEAAELYTLDQLGLGSIELNYHLSNRTDEFGNRFRYRAKVWGSNGQHLGRWAWDVILVRGQ